MSNKLTPYLFYIIRTGAAWRDGSLGPNLMAQRSREETMIDMQIKTSIVYTKNFLFTVTKSTEYLELFYFCSGLSNPKIKGNKFVNVNVF